MFPWKQEMLSVEAARGVLFFFKGQVQLARYPSRLVRENKSVKRQPKRGGFLYSARKCFLMEPKREQGLRATKGRKVARTKGDRWMDICHDAHPLPQRGNHRFPPCGIAFRVWFGKASSST